MKTAVLYIENIAIMQLKLFIFILDYYLNMETILPNLLFLNIVTFVTWLE